MFRYLWFFHSDDPNRSISRLMPDTAVTIPLTILPVLYPIYFTAFSDHVLSGRV